MHPWFAEWGSRDLLPYGSATGCGRTSASEDRSIAASIERITAKDFAEEAAALVERWQTRSSRTTEIGILCRENWQAIAVQKAVRERKLPCELRVGGSFWTSPAVRELRVLLEAVADPDDAAALLELCETRWAAGVLGSQAPTGVEETAGAVTSSVPVAWQTRFAHVAEDGSFLRDDLIAAA